jgi:hypothetical protein
MKFNFSFFNNLNRQLIYTILIVIGCLIIKDFLLVGFTNSDDSTNYITSLVNDTTDAKIWAENQGRFFFYFRVPWAKIPYLFDSNSWLKTVQYVPVALCFYLFSLLISRYFKSFNFGIIVLTFSLAFFAVPSAAFQPPTAYPFLFTSDLALFLLSIYYYQSYLKTHNYANFIAFLIVFTIPFYSYESYIFFYIPLLLYVIYSKSKELKKKRLYSLLINKEVLPLISIGISFILIYFGYRYAINYHANANSYGGNTISSELNIDNLFKLIHNFNRSAFPMYTYFSNQDVFKSIDPNYHHNLFYILKSLTFLQLLIPICLTTILFVALTKLSFKLISVKRFLFLFFGPIIICYAQNILFGITQKYNQDVFNLDGYVTTFASFFGFTLSICMLIIFPLTRITNVLLKYIYIALLCIVTFVISSSTTYSNNKISQDFQISNDKFNLVNTIISNQQILKNAKSTFILDQLNHTNSLLASNVCYNDFNWIGYIYWKSNKKFAYLSENKSGETIVNEKITRSFCILKQIINHNKKIVSILYAPLKKSKLEQNQYISNTATLFISGKDSQDFKYFLTINGIKHTFYLSRNQKVSNSKTFHKLKPIAEGIYLANIYVLDFDIQRVHN